MFKFIIPALFLASAVITGFAGSAQAARWHCLTTITRGGCSVVVYLPDNPSPKTHNKTNN